MTAAKAIFSMDAGTGRRRFPFRLVPLPTATQKHIASRYGGLPSGLAACNHWGLKLSATATEQELEDLYNHPLDPRDVWIVTPPKCGTTWTQEMVWLIANDLDYRGAQTPLSPGRWTFPDFPLICDKQLRSSDQAESNKERPVPGSAGPEHANGGAVLPMEQTEQDAYTRTCSPPRFVKVHLPLSMLPPCLLETCKVIYVARNPKDACVSYYNHQRLIKTHDFTGDLEMFMEDFMAGLQQHGPFVEHMVEAWNLRRHPNLLLLFFEDMKRDLPGQIRRVAQFLNKTLTDEQVARLAHHLSFANFKNNPWCNKESPKTSGEFYSDRGNFMRKGETGDWKNHFTPEMSKRFDAWLAGKLRGTDLSFVMELEQAN